MESLYREQQDLCGRISRCYENFRRKGESFMTAQAAEARVQLLHRYWGRFQENHSKMIDLVTTEKEWKTHDYFTSDYFAVCEEGFLDNETCLKSISKPSTGMVGKVADAPKGEIIQQLPRVSLPRFGGKLTEWRNFKDLFAAMVIQRTQLSEVEKLHYLKTSLYDEPEQLLRNVEVTDGNFARAWKLLEERYENRRVLIFAHLGKLFSIRTAGKESLQELKRIYNNTIECIEALDSLGCPTQHWDVIFQFLVLRALDPQSRKDWEVEPHGEETKFGELKAFLQRRIRAFESISPGQTSARAETRSSHHLATKTKSTGARTCCCYCRGPHFLSVCDDFRRQTLDQRQELVRKEKLCVNCLGRHKLQDCFSRKTCRECGGKHHTTLHESRTEPSPVVTPVTNSHGCLGRTNFLGTAQIIVRDYSGKPFLIKALLDSGSEISLVSEAVAQLLLLPRKGSKVPVVGIGASNAVSARGAIQVEFSPRQPSGATYRVEALVLPRLTTYRTQNIHLVQPWIREKKLQMADNDPSSNQAIGMILGADIYPMLIQRGMKKSPNGAFVAQKTALGWILTGTSDGSAKSQVTSLQCSVGESDEVQLLRRFWEQEEVQNPESVPSPDELECEAHYQATHRRLSDGRYSVSLPFKKSPTLLGNSTTRATNMLYKMEQRFNRDPTLRDLYHSFLREYESLEHMSQIGPTEIPRFCLPHHGVLKASSTTTKLRVVFNGSAKSTSGYSLNDILHTGPQLLPHLDEILLRWRKYKVCFSADIEKMFRGIHLQESDQLYQVIPWRYHQRHPVSYYKLTTVTYGLACSPFLAIRTLHQLAKDEQDHYPIGSRVLQTDVYMDDVLSGGDNLEEAEVVQTELIGLLQRAQLKLRKWTSNQRPLVDRLPVELRATTSERDWSSSEHSILGLRWNAGDDQFQMSIKLQTQVERITKREVLRRIAQLFDPLGFLAPVIVRAKIFMQSLWLTGQSWDEELPENEREKWNDYYQQLPSLSNIAVPRWLGVSSTRSFELHVFADASVRAYGAVAYMRSQDASGIYTVLVAAKTKVAPVKPVSLPRLELSAALLAAQLTTKITKALNQGRIPVTLWSDSTITLSWIKAHPSRWKTYVANRVSTIQNLQPDAVWKYVSTRDNPADLASRGVAPGELKSCKIWWTGPTWLCQQKEEWPSQPLAVDSREEERTPPVSILQTTIQPPSELISRFSTFRRLLRITAWCLRFARNTRGASRRNPDLTVAELDEAKKQLIRLEQSQFHNEIIALGESKSLPASSKLSKLNPFLDEHRILRVGGRLQHAALEFPEKHPIILPHSSHLTNLLIQEVHARTLHGGLQLTLATVRREYWVIKGRTTVKSVIHRCKVCLRFRGSTLYQQMGNLPRTRVQPSRPFTHCGVDYAGPIIVRRHKGRGAGSTKGYVCVFVCFSTKAVHLEFISDYTTQAFLAGLRRFISRRGLCATITSDRGTNFVGAAAELARNAHLLDHQQIQRFCTNQGIEWKFSPASAPHFGGLWEAAVKSVKRHLLRTIKDSALTFEEYVTLLAEIEAVLNSRPLVPLRDDPEDIDVLTPGHFLIGTSLLALPEPEVEQVPVNRLSRWQLIQRLRDTFWRRWSTEYLQLMQVRSKWSTAQSQIRIGDLVLIKGETTPPSRWPLARVVGLHPGPDGLVRVVELRTATTTLRRPVVKLVLLQRDNDRD